MNQELIANILNQLKDANICEDIIYSVERIFNSSDIITHIDKYNKYDVFPKINVHTPSTNTTHNLPIHPQDINFLKKINKRQYLELVEQKEPQKVAIKLWNFEDKALFIKDLLQKYLNSIGHKGDTISFTKVEEGYELIIYDLFVNNSKERVDFIVNFKNSIDKNLHKYINLNDSFNETEYDYWLSINSLINDDNDIWPDFKLVNKLNNNGKFYGFYININNTTNININTQNNINFQDDFINYIMENKPEWYIAGEYIDIKTFHEEYRKFDPSANKRSFARKFKGKLWNKNKKGSFYTDGLTRYLLLDLW